ncbi:MAG TPA: hypothetical protein VFI17_03515 [Solirubrobacterales bacterium]|nr:hypothetical protein [Solirubrobacterales bacterium]
MAEAPATGKGPLKKLTPKQKRYAMVLGAAAVLALIYLLQRRSAAPAEGQSPSTAESAGAGSPSYPVSGGGGTDPSAFIGAQSEQIGSALGEVSSGLGEVSGGLGEVIGSNDRLGVQVETNLDEIGEAQARTLAALGKQGKNITAIRKKLAKPPRPVKGKPGSGKPHSKAQPPKPTKGKPGSGKPHSKPQPPKPQPRPNPRPPAPKAPKKKGK